MLMIGRLGVWARIALRGVYVPRAVTDAGSPRNRKPTKLQTTFGALTIWSEKRSRKSRPSTALRSVFSGERGAVRSLPKSPSSERSK